MLFNEQEVAFAKDVKLHNIANGDVELDIDALILDSSKLIKQIRLGSAALLNASDFLSSESPAASITDEQINAWDNPALTFSGSIPVILADGKSSGPYVNGDNFEFTDAGIIDLITQLLQEVINPTFVNPSFSIALPNYTLREVGSTYSALLTASFNRGRINGKLVSSVWNSSSLQDYRAGLASTYNLDGTLQAGFTLMVSRVLVDGNNTFTGTVNYLTGPQPVNSINGNFDSSYPPGSLTDSKNIPATYPVFYGTLLPTEDIDDIDLSTFTKSIITSTGTVSIPYSSIIDKKLVIIIPSTSTTKTKWYVNALNNGFIGGIGDLFATPVNKNFDSPSTFWTDKTYKVYISNRTSIDTIIELRNA